MTITPSKTRYRRFDPQFWTDKRIQSLTPLKPSAMGFFIFLLTCREGGFIPGVILLGVAAAAEILGWELAATQQALKELCDARLVKADIKSRLMYIMGAIRTNPPANFNVVTGWAMTWHEVPDCSLKGEIWEELKHQIVARGKMFEKAFYSACPDPFGNGLANGSGNIELETEKEPEQENEPEDRTSSSNKASEFLAGSQSEGQDIPAGHQRKSKASSRESSHSPSTDDLVHPISASESSKSSKENTRSDVSNDSSRLLATPDPVITTAIERVCSEWSMVCTPAGSPFREITASIRAKHTPTIIKSLEDPQWLPYCLEVISWLPSNNFYAGRVPNPDGKDPFVASFGYVINHVHQIHENMVKDVTKREKLAKAHRGSDLPPAHQQGELLGNHYERMQAKKTEVSQNEYPPPTAEEMQIAEEEMERCRQHEAKDSDTDEDYL